MAVFRASKSVVPGCGIVTDKWDKFVWGRQSERRGKCRFKIKERRWRR